MYGRCFAPANHQRQAKISFHDRDHDDVLRVHCHERGVSGSVPQAGKLARLSRSTGRISVLRHGGWRVFPCGVLDLQFQELADGLRDQCSAQFVIPRHDKEEKKALLML